jgi:hypothetical protein
MRFLENEQKFLEYSWIIYEPYFNDQNSFLGKYNSIDSPENKNNFLRVISYYLFFVREGNYSSPKYDIHDLSFVNQTYKFIAIIALIESLYAKNDYIDFYQWIMRNRKNGALPINDQKDAERIYKIYKTEHGNTLNVVRFFQSLNDQTKLFISKSIIVLEESGTTGELDEKVESIEMLSSDFIHRAELVLEFDPGQFISIRDGTVFHCSIELEHLCKIFELGILQYFNITPDKNQI